MKERESHLEVISLVPTSEKLYHNKSPFLPALHVSQLPKTQL